MNIFGEGFPQEIVDQVAIRQKVYGSGFTDGISRTPEDIIYLNSRTAWCKFSSAVYIENINEINNPTIKNLGLSGNELAKQFILFNGTAASNGSGAARGGIDRENSLLGNDKAYGIGGTEFGLRPMMGIISATVNHENRGSLRRAEIKIKAFNRAQFEIIDVLYMRLGFDVLLEWGNSLYLDNNGTLVTNVDNSLANNFIEGTLDGKIATYENFLKKIYDQRISTCGNYDAIFAKVTNFHWSFLPDGSYDITINLASAGDIIESLKVNVLLAQSKDAQTSGQTKAEQSEDQKEALEDGDPGDIIESFSNAHTIGNFLYMMQQFVDDQPDEGNLVTGSEIQKFSLNDKDIDKIQKKIQDTDGYVKFDASKFLPNNIDALLYQFDDQSLGTGYGDSDRYYIRLGTFLQFLELYIVPRIIDPAPEDGSNSKILNFDYDELTNIMNLHPLQVAVDPRICVTQRKITVNKTEVPVLTYVVAGAAGALALSIPVFGWALASVITTALVVGAEEETEIVTFTYGSENQKNPFQSSITIPNKSDLYANIMNIYVDMAFILKKIEELKDDKGNLSLIDFLQGIMSGLNESLGGINDFDVFIDETTNMVKIIDKNPLNNLEEIINLFNDPIQFPSASFYNGGRQLSTTPAFFDLYGYYDGTGNASFIKDFSFTTELTPQLSTMITVGATSNGAVVGEDETALSNINKGLSNRYKQKITNDINKDDNTLANSEKDLEERKQELKDMYNNYIEFLENLAHNSSGWDFGAQEPEATVEEIDANKSTLQNYIQKAKEIDNLTEYINKIKIPKPIAGTGFIPFNLSLTMDGLAGMKINQNFNIDVSFLPSNYPQNVRFLIKNMTHEIANNTWSTKLESYCVAKQSDVEGTVTTANTPSPSPQPPTPQPSPTPTPTPTTSTTTVTPSSQSQSNQAPTQQTNGTWANKLRKVIKNLGYTEKGNEIDSGGDISEDIYKAASNVLTTIKKELPSLQVKVTSGNDAYHQQLSYISRHKKANAIDFVITPSTPNNLDAVVKILQRYAAGNAPYFRFIDEYRNLTKAGTANHFHISWGVGTESQSEINKAIALANKGIISPIKVA